MHKTRRAHLNTVATNSCCRASDARPALRHLVELGHRRIAFVGGRTTHDAAIGAGAAARQRGLSLPGDLSVVALQDRWFAEFADPPLTVVSMPMREAGRQAARLVFEHLGGQPLSDVVVRRPAPRLVRRGSTVGSRSAIGTR